MTATPNLQLSLLDEAQESPEVKVNDAFYRVDGLCQGCIIARTLTAPPGGEQEGDAYIPATGATGAWAGHVDDVAIYQGGGYRFYRPRTGWEFWSIEDLAKVRFGVIGSPSTWTVAEDGGQIAVGTPGSPTFLVESVERIYFDNASVTDQGDGSVLVSPTAGAGPATAVTYDNDASGLSAANVQDAIDELASGGGLTLAQEILADTPTAFWKCDETSGTVLADSSGNGRDLALTGTYTLADKPIVPSIPATRFIRFGTGGTSYGSRADSAGLTIPPVGDYTFEAVVQDIQSSFGAVLTMKEPAANYQASMAVSSRKLDTFWEFSSGTNVQTTLSAGEFDLGRIRPRHIAIVKDGTANTIAFYVDGLRQQDTPTGYGNEPSATGAASTYVGGNNVDGGCNGSVAYVAFYEGQKLSDSRIMAHAKAAGLYGG